MQNNYTVINASAGSGKTYSLVQNLLAICLKYPDQHEKIRQVLALTFTNKAANEMKHRIIEWLKNFIKEDYASNRDLLGIQEKIKQDGVQVTLDDLHLRAKKTLDYILHHYSTLNIGTIDKFNSRLVRSFSHELGLAQNFNLEIKPEPFLMEAVDKMLDEIGTNSTISDAFMDYVNYGLENEERVNLSKTLYTSAKEYVQDKHFFRLDENRNFDWEAYENARQNLRNNIQDLKNDSINIANETLQLLREKNLNADDFATASGGTIGKFFENVLAHFQKKEKFPFAKSDEDTVQEKYRKGASSKSKKRQPEILDLIEQLIENRQQIIDNYILQKQKEKILHAILPLKVNKEIQDKLAEIEEENDLVLLSKFNVLIHENLREEPSAFIYEKIGTQFSHYFFDEFQDTSFIQWQNFSPLKDHALSQENMTFTLVGDPKQSIYRFRGGDAQLMLDIINKKEKTPPFAKIENLQNNWRSAVNIVHFNNELYAFMAEKTNDEHREIFVNSHQLPQAKFPGRVRVNLIENNTKTMFYEEVAEKMREDLQSLLNDGFQLSDITILCRGNVDIFSYTQLLGNLKVHYKGEEVFIKTISEAGLTLNLSPTLLAITEFLRWQQNPDNLQFAVRMMYYLKILGRIKTEDFSAEMMHMLSLNRKDEMENHLFNKYHINLKSNELTLLNLYNYIEHFLHEFSIPGKETDFIFSYLEMVYGYTQNTGATLKDFLKYWDEEAHATKIQQSENIDAVQLMTIHKAKGLEFPVVFLPMNNENKDGKFTNWMAVENEAGLSSVNISPFTKDLEQYSPEIEKFNQAHIYENKIDRFCLQYVATTRPVEQLFFYIQKPNNTSNHLEIYEFLRNKIPRNESGEELSSFDLYEVSDEIIKKQAEKETTERATIAVEFEHETAKNRDSIQIATPSRNYQNRIEKVRIGIFVHEILAQINTAAELEKVLESYLLAGTITGAEKAEIADRIDKIIQNEAYAKYFSGHQKMINEKDIMISENGGSRIYRPDRIIDTGNGYIILDFKTGEKQEKHEQQVAAYRSVLEKLGKSVLETVIIYG